MEQLYDLHSTPDNYPHTTPNNSSVPFPATDFQPFDTFYHQIPIFESPEQMFSAATSSSAISDAASMQRCRKNNTCTGSEDELSSAIRAKIASHPLYPKLLQAYMDCQKVGAPSDVADLLEEIEREKVYSKRSVSSTYLGDDPELDEFMVTYSELLVKYKSDFARPFNEATTFLNDIESQLHNLCNSSSRTCVSDETTASSEEDFGAREVDMLEYDQIREDRELRDKLHRKYSGYISLLKNEFSNKKKKAKLPGEARQVLMDWWTIHYKWPYPTEADKVALADSTGLDQKQINNWFINQRKRHWKPSENMQFDIMENLYGPLFMNKEGHTICIFSFSLILIAFFS